MSAVEGEVLDALADPCPWCPHALADHLGERPGVCLHSTPAETWACACRPPTGLVCCHGGDPDGSCVTRCPTGPTSTHGSSHGAHTAVTAPDEPAGQDVGRGVTGR